MNKSVKIILPNNIYILKEKPSINLRTETEEYNIYFENIIYPYKKEYDVLVECNFGINLGRCWTINEFPDVDEASFVVRVYDEYGEMLAQKSSKIHFVEKKKHMDFINVLCIGDSMTRSQIYLEHIFHKLHKVSFVGTRTFDGHIYHEGRGGWSFKTYYNNTGVEGIAASPFLFPKNIDGNRYAGEYSYIEKTMEDAIGDYWFEGFVSKPISYGDVFLKQGILYERTDNGDVVIDENPEFDISFSKYIDKSSIEKPDVISILMGANDLQICSYEESELRINKYIEDYKKFILSVREYDKELPIIINLPIISGEDYHWGIRKIRTSAKTYRYNILKAAERLIELEGNNIFISPMLSAIDIQNGFPKLGFSANKYTENVEIHQNNWVHPNNSGYMQMGDALAPIIEKLHGSLRVSK